MIRIYPLKNILACIFPQITLGVQSILADISTKDMEADIKDLLVYHFEPSPSRDMWDPTLNHICLI